MTGQTYFASYKQWQSKGAQVRKGAKGVRIVFFKMLEKENKQGEKSSFPLLRYSTVFAADQVDGWEAPEVKEATSDVEIHAAAEAWIKATGATVTFNSAGKASYTPSTDTISMPCPESFKATETSTATECYYSTAFHELTHWTGCKKRLDRINHAKFGDAKYAAEELVAEIGAAMQCAHLGISVQPRADHIQYMQSWLRALENDKRLIFTAAAAAQKAVDLIASFQAAEEVAA